MKLVSKTCTITTHGQITIPIAVRRHLGLEIGEQLLFEVTKDGVVVMKKLRMVEEAPRPLEFSRNLPIGEE